MKDLQMKSGVRGGTHARSAIGASMLSDEFDTETYQELAGTIDIQPPESIDSAEGRSAWFDGYLTAMLMVHDASERFAEVAEEGVEDAEARARAEAQVATDKDESIGAKAAADVDTDAEERPPCPDCGTLMIVAVGGVYVCPSCGTEMSIAPSQM